MGYQTAPHVSSIASSISYEMIAHYLYKISGVTTREACCIQYFKSVFVEM